MPVSGNEEPAVKSFARRSSDSVAGIPIKKRRFMLFPHSSPPSHAQTLPPAEKNSVEKKQLNPSQESSLKDASVVTSSSLSDAKKNSPGGKCQSSVANLFQSNDNLSRVKNQESSLTVESGSLHDRDKKDKFIVAKKSGSQIGSGNTELQLAPKDHLVLNVKKEISREQNVEGNVEGTGKTSLPSLTVESGSLHDRDRKDKFIVPKKSGSQIGSGNTELQLAPKDHLVLNVKNEILREQNVEGNVEGTGKMSLPSLTVGSGSPDDRDRKDKFIVTKKSGGQVVTGNTKLQLAPKEVLVPNVRKEISREQKVQGNHISESSIALGNTELSLGPKEPPVLALAGQHGEGSCQMQEKLDPISWNLSLSKGKSSTQCKRDEIDLKVHGIHLHANRSNWDLNTTMDAWEGSLNDAAAGQRTISHSGLDAPSGICDIKPVISSTEMIGTLVASGKQRPISNEHQSRFAISNPLDQQYKSDDSLSLRLSPSSCLQSNTHREHFSAAAKEDSSSAFSSSDFPRVMVSTCKPNRDGHTIVKSEPIDGSTKKEYKGTKAKLMGLLDGRTLKNESVERCGLEALKSANLSALKLGAAVIKSEPAVVGIQETPKATGETLTLNHSGAQVPQCLTNCSSSLPLPITSLMRHPSELPTRSTQLFISGDVLRQSECSTNPKGVHLNRQLQKESGDVEKQVDSVVVSTSSCDEVKESNVSDGMMDIQGSENANVDSNDLCRLKLIDELPLDLCENDDGSVSDEEKINISADMLEEGSYDSDYESDGNYALDTAMDANQHGGEDDDYEDGEVREPLEETAMEGPVCEKIIAEDVNCDSDNRKTDFLGVTCDGRPSTSQIKECNTKVEDTVETNIDCSKGCINTVLNEETDRAVDKDSSLQEPLASEMPTIGENKNESIKTSRREPLEISGRCDELKSQGAELSYEQTTNASQGAPVTFNQGAEEEKNKSTDLEVNNESALPMAEASLSGDVAAKDANSAGNRSRIITLSRSSNVSPSGKTRFIPGRPLPSRTGRERFTDPVLEEKVYPRGRDEFYFDTPHKYLRERNQDQLLRNSRLNYMRGRGRGSRRFNTPRSDWDSDRDFAPDLYNDSAEFRFPRHKHVSALADTELECNDYMIAPDDSVVGPGRGGRKPLNDEVPIFRHPTSRRRSPGGRDGPLRGVQMVRRTPRNISPNRCIDDDGSEMVGLRHTENFMRGLPDDIDPMFTRSQPPYEEVDGHFIRGNRNFSSLQGRGMPRIRSKSPLRSGTRSPGPWPSPRRRSPEGFNGHPGLTRRRSPQVYRMERMRSPDRACFPREMMTRRHGSPPFLSRPSSDMRDMDSGREHAHPRSVICNRRSPPGRVLPRNNSRRFEIVDPRERTGDEYFGQPVHPGRFDEVGGDGSGGDDRRRIGERRGPIRSFRPPYNSSDGEDFCFNVEDAPRPYRLCPEGEPEFHERGNLREREFDRRIKNRPGNAPRRMRSIEEQEGNYRQGGQVWHDDGFNDIQLKRRRF